MRAVQVIIISSVMFTFISYWRTAAVVLCDLASTAYYIGGIVEHAIGPAAPWFIVAVLLFSYAVRSIYIESCSLFIRGGVYRVVREALGKFMAKIAVSALLFDYVLTGPISSVSAGQYIMALLLETLERLGGVTIDANTRKFCKDWGSVLIASTVTVYFFRQNLLGIHESSDKALKIMIITAVMGVVIIGWSCVTLAVRANTGGVINDVPLEPRLVPRVNPATGEEDDPLGFLHGTKMATAIRNHTGTDWFSLFGLIGLFMAFGHSILAMSGEETLAQVYREVESPKLPNLKKAAFIIFLFSLVLTGGISFLAVLLIPNQDRLMVYSDNLIGGLAMNVIGPAWARLLLNAFVVVVGFLILSGAVNTAIIGSNGVLNRVAEDGVIPDWFRKPHPRYGTTYRILYLILGLQLFTIIASRGDVLLLGEAYAFGVVWSFVFQALSMVVLRFKDPRPREAKVPLNIKINGIEFPVGLILIMLVLLISAICNLLTKEAATIGGLIFTGVFFVLFYLSELYHEKRRGGNQHEHLEQFNQAISSEITPQSLGLSRRYRKLVAIRSTQNLYMLEKALAETDPQTTDVVVMTAKQLPVGQGASLDELDLSPYDQQLMTAVVTRAEKAGKKVRPLIIPTNNPLHAILNTAKDLNAHEVILGASNIYTVEEQLDQIDFYWINLHAGQTAPLTVRLLTRDRDIYHDLAGGNRIPKISERRARSVAELRAAGIGVDKVLLLHDGTPTDSDLFQDVLTMLDEEVRLTVIQMGKPGEKTVNGETLVQQEQDRAKQLGRELQIAQLADPTPEAVVLYAQQNSFDLIIVALPHEPTDDLPARVQAGPAAYLVQHAHCRVLLAAAPIIPSEIVDTTPSSADLPPPPAPPGNSH
jgi:amino acid transporter/nucleotide-binding universal stress UspA family protein